MYGDKLNREKRQAREEPQMLSALQRTALYQTAGQQGENRAVGSFKQDFSDLPTTSRSSLDSDLRHSTGCDCPNCDRSLMPNPFSSQSSNLLQPLQYAKRKEIEPLSDAEYAFALEDDLSSDEETDDDDWVPSGIGVRPAKPKRIWEAIYGKNNSKKPGYRNIPCAEKGDGDVEVHNKTGIERSKSKRPPVCHIIPYNHLNGAWTALRNDSQYKGPLLGGPNYEKAHQDLAWGDLGNLQAGHATCNSQTAHTGQGAPSSKAVNYVRSWARGEGYL